jgi:hypothetical protein
MKIDLSGLGLFILLVLLIGSLPLSIVLNHRAAPLRERIDALERVVIEKELLINRQTMVILDVSEEVARNRLLQKDQGVR